MYEEKYKKRDKNKDSVRLRGTFGQWLTQALIVLFAAALTLAIAIAGLLYALPPVLFFVEPDGMELSLSDSLPHTCLNVLLLGVDVKSQGMQRSDSMMIASIGFGKFKLTSVLRDTVVEIPGHGRGKLNAAYAYGGPELVMRTLNHNFGLNLMHYALADYAALIRIVDAVGGVEVSVDEHARATVSAMLNDARDALTARGYAVRDLTETGDSVHLDGVQALAYARIREGDSDYQRTRRQRRIVSAIVQKVKHRLWDLPMLCRLTRAALEAVETNMSTVQVLSLSEKALMASDVDTLRLPVDESMTDDGSKLEVHDFAANHNAFARFVFEGGE